jgi:uncharacterized protein
MSAPIAQPATDVKPLPPLTDFNREFWAAARKHEFVLQQCDECGKAWAPNGPVCPHCFSETYHWERMSGRGRIASWVVFHKAYHPAFEKELPYNVAFVELEEGPRVISNVVGIENDALEIGLPVEVVFEDVEGGMSLPKFRPAAK